MITISHRIPVNLIKEHQEVVKSSDGRFVSESRITHLKSHHVTIEFNCIKKYNSYWAMWRYYTSSYTERKSPWYKKLIRKIKGRLKLVSRKL